MKTKTRQKSFLPEDLIGQWFLSFNETTGSVKWQGIIIGNPEPGWYLLQLFDWIMGEPSVRRVIRIEDMKDWLFYESVEAMKFAYDNYFKKKE